MQVWHIVGAQGKCCEHMNKGSSHGQIYTSETGQLLQRFGKVWFVGRALLREQSLLLLRIQASDTSPTMKPSLITLCPPPALHSNPYLGVPLRSQSFSILGLFSHCHCLPSLCDCCHVTYKLLKAVDMS